MQNSFFTKLFPVFATKPDSIKTELMAGLTTFLTMAYIIAVNPSILSETGMDAGALVTTTCLASAFGCFIMGFFANMPFGLMPGMGLNAFFTYTVVLGMGVPWHVALTAVFVEGIIFILLTLCKVREAVVYAIPENMKHAVTAGIGLFIAFIGLKNTGVIVGNESTYVGLGDMTFPVIMTCLGVVLIAILEKRGVRGSILIGIVVCSILSWIYALISPEAAATAGIYLPEGTIRLESIAPIAGQLDFSFFNDKAAVANFLVVMLTFLFVDFFDTVGTVVGVCASGNMIDKDGNVPNISRVLMTDAIATTAGALMGTSTITTGVESSVGVNQGGRTGYTAITIGVLFLMSMFFAPIIIAVPGCATAPALVYVGYLMLKDVKNIDIDNITEGMPAFVTIIMMPLTYSIGDGLVFGVLSYVFINILHNLVVSSEKRVKVSPVMIVLAILFVLKLWLF